MAIKVKEPVGTKIVTMHIEPAVDVWIKIMEVVGLIDIVLQDILVATSGIVITVKDLQHLMPTVIMGMVVA